MTRVPTIPSVDSTVIKLEGVQRPRVGDVLALIKSPELSHEGEVDVRCALRISDACPLPLGPHVLGYWQQLYINLGPHVVEEVTADAIRVRALPLDPAAEEASFRLAVRRLRTLAGSELLRVRVRDREVALVDPGNSVAFAGTVNAAFAWLCGFPEWNGS